MVVGIVRCAGHLDDPCPGGRHGWAGYPRPAHRWPIVASGSIPGQVYNRVCRCQSLSIIGAILTYVVLPPRSPFFTMPRSIRIISPQRQKTFSECLEDRARKIVGKLEDLIDGSGPVEHLRREVAIAVDHLDSLRKLHTELRRRLLRLECYVDNELHDMEMRTPKYSPYRFPEREKLQRRLIKIEDERRRLAQAEEEQVQRLQDRLLDLLNKRHLLGP